MIGVLSAELRDSPVKGRPPSGELRDAVSLPAGKYRAHAVLAGKPVLREETNSDMPGLSTMACWTGTAHLRALAERVAAQLVSSGVFAAHAQWIRRPL